MKHNMKQFLFGMALAASAALFAEDGLQIRTTGGWAKEPDGFSLDYGTAKKGAVYLTRNVTPHTIYRIAWRAERATPETPAPMLFVETSRKHYVQFDGANRVHYWNSGDETTLKLRFDIDHGKPGKIHLRDIRVTEVAPAELNRNLIENGDWEQGELGDFWQSRDAGIIPGSAVLANSPDFFSGSRSLCLKPSAQKPDYTIRSAYMPVIPGDTFVLTFWGKSDVDTTLGGSIDCASPANIHKGKHPHKIATFKLTPDWNEYRLEYTVPRDLAAYPALADGVARIWFSRGAKGTIYLDNLEFRRTAPATAQ